MTPRENTPPGSPPRVTTQRLGWRALSLIGFCALCGTTAEVFMKIGAVHAVADEAGAVAGAGSWLSYLGLTSRWLWLSILFTLGGFAAWTLTMRTVPLSVAFPLANVVHVLIPLCSWWFLGESIGPRRWAGIALVVTGLVVVAKPYAALEERR